MPPLDPLPFRLSRPGRDAFEQGGARSVSYRLDGLLHLGEHSIVLEWSGTEHVQHVSLTEVRDDIDRLPLQMVDIPLAWLTEASVTGGWWRPRLVLRARRLDAFDQLPGSRPGTVALRVARRDRAHAREMALAIAEARVDATLTAPASRPALERPRDDRLP